MEAKCRFGFKFKMISNLLDKNITRAVSPMDLTATQSAVLGYIIHHGGGSIYPRDIESNFGLKHPTVTGILGRLYDKEFIEFRADDRDKRFKCVTATDRGMEYHRKVKSILSQMEQSITAGFSQEEIVCMDSMLDRIIKNVSEM